MAQRFYPVVNTTEAVPSISPAFDANWEVTGSATRRNLREKGNTVVLSNTNTSLSTVITTTQDYLAWQFISQPLPQINFTTADTIQIVAYANQSVSTANASLAYVIKIISNDGATVRGTLLTQFAGSAFGTSQASYSTGAVAFTGNVTAQAGDRLLVEVGCHCAAPSTSATINITFRDSTTSDYAGSGTTSPGFNTWIEISRDIFALALNNYQSIKVGDGMSTGERIR
jgi:hypothetical protein